jgi:hypothetical protein
VSYSDADYEDAGYCQCRVCGAWNDGGSICSLACERAYTEAMAASDAEDDGEETEAEPS